MDKPFDIQFDFPVEQSGFTVALKAIAQLHHSEPYYVVHSFHLADSRAVRPLPPISILPAQEIKYLSKGDTGSWVHKDSERESMLSLALGKAIEESGYHKNK
jgi:hypothetical protein